MTDSPAGARAACRRPRPAGPPAPTSWSIGSGIAGLTAALRLHAADRSLHGPGRHQGRPRRRLDPVGAGRHRRGARAGGHPRAARARHPRRRRGRLRRRGRAGPGHRGPRRRPRADRARHQFDHHPDGELSLTREGGHHRDRIAHAGGDATGAEIQRALIAAVERAPEIEVIQHALAVDLLARRRRRRRRRDPARARRGPARRRRRGALPGRRARHRRPRPGLLARPPTRRSRPATAWRSRCAPARRCATSSSSSSTRR